MTEFEKLVLIHLGAQTEMLQLIAWRSTTSDNRTDRARIEAMPKRVAEQIHAVASAETIKLLTGAR